MRSKSKNISEVLVSYLEFFGIDTVFGIIGAGNAAIFNSLTYSNKFKIYCLHHEQSVIMAAQNYFKIKNKVSLALVTTGGGSSNAFTGLLSSWMDSIPALVISGNEKSIFCKNSNKQRIWGVQGFNSKKTFEDYCINFQRINSITNFEKQLIYFFNSFKGKRFGVNWLEIPINIQSKEIKIDKKLKFKKLEIRNNYFFNPYFKTKNHKNKFINVIKLIINSKKPIIIAGNGIRQSNAQKIFLNFIDILKIPFLLTWSSIDMISNDHKLYRGKSGVYGERRSNLILQNSDLILCIGTRLSPLQINYDINNFAPKAKIVNIDIDNTELDKFDKIRKIIKVNADAKFFLENLIHFLYKNKLDFKFDHWLMITKKIFNYFPLIEKGHLKNKDKKINSYLFIESLNKFTKSNDIIVTDMGTALLTAFYNLKIKKGMRLTTSLGLGEMGYGLPGAIGSAITSKRVICLNCDGGMMFNLQELETIKYHNLNIKIVIFSNDGYLMIKHTQNSLFNNNKIAVDKKTGVSCPNFEKIGKAFGIQSSSISMSDQVDQKLKKFLSLKGPSILEVHMDPKQLFEPKASSFKDKNGNFSSSDLANMFPYIEDKQKNFLEKLLLDI